MPSVELQRERAAERQTKNMWALESARSDDRGEAVGMVTLPEGIGRIR
jgi:hypothetical protein